MSGSMLVLGILLQLHDQVSGKLGGVKDRLSDLQQTGDKLIKFGTVASGVGLALRPIANASQGLIADVARNAASLDDMSARIRSMPGITETAVERLTNAGRAWAREHANFAEEFLDASYQMLSAGLNEAQALSATQVGLTVAKATMGNAAETANLLALSYNNFGDKARDSTKEITSLGDVLTKTQQVFQISSMGQLAAGLQFATPAALGARMRFAEMNTVIGQLNSAGMQGSIDRKSVV
jgi:TP901 family phage tail tape measure protein